MTQSKSNSEPNPVVAVIGGGFAGTMFALKYMRVFPRARVFVVEPEGHLGRGLAYGACSEFHVLNVPVRRMEMGLEPSFASWLVRHPADIAEALVESGGDINDAFVPRFLLGRYLEEQIASVMARGNGPGVVHLRAKATHLLDLPAAGVRLGDGRRVHADVIVMALGNLPPRSPFRANGGLSDMKNFIADPWAADALQGISPADPVLFVGTGLTMIDVALKLAARLHAGPMLAVSRHGLLPRIYKIGGRWELTTPLEGAPLRIFMRRLRAEMDKAESFGVSWQRVLDAIRPRIPEIWQTWPESERRQFLRHLRTIWDVHRHRMAPRVANKLEALRDRGQLRILAGRIGAFERGKNGTLAEIEPRGGGHRLQFEATHIINCTGPRSDIEGLEMPLITDLRRRGLIARNPLGLGIETVDTAIVDARGLPSSRLYAVGALTRPYLWEITSVAELNAQIGRLVAQLATNARRASVANAFGLGIGLSDVA
jgi:uncharacterized NAD(P)/FAD-binding protein YdhS